MTGEVERQDAVHHGWEDAGPVATLLLVVEDPAVARGERRPPRQVERGDLADVIVEPEERIAGVEEGLPARAVRAERREHRRPIGHPLPRRLQPQVIEPFVVGRAAVGEREHRAMVEHDEERDHRAARPAREPVDVDRAPAGEEDELGRQRRHRVPREQAEEGQVDAREDADARDPAQIADALRRPAQPPVLERQAQEPQRQVALDRGGDVAGEALADPPAPVAPLPGEEVAGDGFPPVGEIEAERVPQEDVLRCDGGVRLELGAPVVAALDPEEEVLRRPGGLARAGDQGWSGALQLRRAHVLLRPRPWNVDTQAHQADEGMRASFSVKPRCARWWKTS